LDITAASDASAYFCPKTTYNLRRIVLEHELDGVLFETVTGKLAEVFGIDTRKQRLDSVHIRSDMKKLGHLGIMVRTTHKFLVNLKRQHPELFDGLDSRFAELYLTKKAVGCFSLVKSSEASKKLLDAATDLFELVGLFADNAAVSSPASSRNTHRVASFTDVTKDSTGRRPQYHSYCSDLVASGRAAPQRGVACNCWE